MKIWQWARCLECPVCGSGEHQQCVHVQSGRVTQYHTQRMILGRTLMEEMNDLKPGSTVRGAARSQMQLRALLIERDGPTACSHAR